MNKNKQRTSAANKLLSQKVTKLEPVNLSESSFVPKGMTKAFRNNRITVMIYENIKTDKGFCIQVLVQNHFNSPIYNHWKTMQKIKNELFGEETIAIEFYPKESELVDVHNIYWMWIFPEEHLPKPIVT